MRQRLRLGEPVDEIQAAIVDALVARYVADGAPVIDGAVPAVERLALFRPLAVASGAHPALIVAALDSLGIRDRFAAIVSADDVTDGKPAPDVYLEAARRLAVAPDRALVVEDSLNGVLAGKAAGMRVVLIPNARVPPVPPAADRADLVLPRLSALLLAVVGEPGR
jgi:HAD superfamily hydrolase (TIGR01509 family)